MMKLSRFQEVAEQILMEIILVIFMLRSRLHN